MIKRTSLFIVGLGGFLILAGMLDDEDLWSDWDDEEIGPGYLASSILSAVALMVVLPGAL